MKLTEIIILSQIALNSLSLEANLENTDEYWILAWLMRSKRKIFEAILEWEHHIREIWKTCNFKLKLDD
jgi:hypothetical protein